jgi:hypothetical protein
VVVVYFKDHSPLCSEEYRNMSVRITELRAKNLIWNLEMRSSCVMLSAVMLCVVEVSSCKFAVAHSERVYLCFCLLMMPVAYGKEY